MNKAEVVKFDAVEHPELFELAMVIRTEVFVVEQSVPEEMELDEFDPEATHFLLYSDEIPVGTARYRYSGDRIKLERFAILQDYRNCGFGRLLLHFVLNTLEGCSKVIYCHAQIGAYSYWHRNGFQSFGANFFEAGIEHVTMRFKPDCKS